jgi:subtilisin family serine protease
MNQKKNAFDILINAPEAAGIKTSLWFEMEGKEAESRMFIASGYFYNTKMNIRTGDAVKGYNIHSPGSAPGVICVGATSYRHSYYNYLGNYFESSAFIDGHRAHYSSIGPTIDGRIKPDVVAPGTNVIAAYSSYYLEANPDASDIESDVSHFDFNGRTYAWNANTGTSMSTPVVAGIIALWLEACPTLTTAGVIEIFKNTCIHPEPSMTYPNNEYGYGAINAYRGLLYILGLDPSLGIDTVSANQPEKIKFSLEDRLLKIHFDKSAESSGLLHIYTISGQKVKSLPISKDCQQIDLSNLNTGIYAVQISTNNKSTTGSTLIRLQ